MTIMAIRGSLTNEQNLHIKKVNIVIKFLSILAAIKMIFVDYSMDEEYQKLNSALNGLQQN